MNDDIAAPPTEVDVLIVGAGPAGLAAAYHLRDSGLRIAVLERNETVGGRTLTATLSGVPVNTGAMWVYVGTESEAMCQALGIETLPVSPPTFGVHLAETTVLSRDDDELIAGLPLESEAQRQLERILASVREEYARGASTAGLNPESDKLSEITLADQLGEVDSAVWEIVRNAVTGGSTADPADLSAQYALRYFASYLVRSDDHRRFIPGGMQTISLELARRLGPEVVHPNHDVIRVARDSGGGFLAELVASAGARSVRADQVVLAVPGPGVAEVFPEIAAEHARTIERIRTSPTVVLSIVVESEGVEDWNDLFLVATVGRPFNIVMQPFAAAGTPPSKLELSYFNCYLSADPEAAEPGDDEALAADWLEQFLAVVPSARGRAVETLVTRWQRCFAFPAPGRQELAQIVQRPLDGLHLAGDYTSLTAGSHGALLEGRRVAEAILGG
jgi:phytoene dehydrogenase-like protein